MTFLLILLAIVTAPIWLPLIIILIAMIWIAVFWAIGVPFSVNKDGKRIGYIRWTKFHREK